MGKFNPFISIIIPVRNAEKTLDTTFKYLENIDYPREKMEIVIADGGSTDKTLEVIKNWQSTRPYIKLVNVPNCPSPGYARNKALDVVKGEFILFTDGDCAPCKEWVSEMLSHFERDPQIAAVGGEIYTLMVDPNNLTELYCQHFRFNMVAPRYGFIGEGYYPPLSDMGASQIAGHRAFFFVTANVAYRKAAIDKEKARFWDRPTGEDIEFGIKIRKAGWKFYFAPKAKVDHMHRSTPEALFKVWVTYGKAHPPLVGTYAKPGIEIILQNYKCKLLMTLPTKTKGFIYLGYFQLLHFWGVLAAAGLLVSLITQNSGAWWFTLVTGLLALYNAYGFSKTCFTMTPRKHFFFWYKMKYITNLRFSQGGLIDSKKYGTFCIEPSF